jgi:hypothetical protein
MRNLDKHLGPFMWAFFALLSLPMIPLVFVALMAEYLGRSGGGRTSPLSSFLRA